MPAPLARLAVLPFAVALATSAQARETSPAQSAEPTLYELGQTVKALAFDATRFFQSEGNATPFLTAYYGGDDYDYPVYAFALNYSRECRGPSGAIACTSVITARMVRARGHPDVERPRWAGTALLAELHRRGAFSQDDIADNLSDAGAQWLEAEVSSCPGARQLVQPRISAGWFGFAFPDAPPPPPTMHADNVEIAYSWRGASSRYDGPVTNGSPARWADDLVRALEPCWTPAQVPAPWLAGR